MDHFDFAKLDMSLKSLPTELVARKEWLQQHLFEKAKWREDFFKYDLPDPKQHAYSRFVLYASPHLEIMLARWHPQKPCAPHDHGGAMGVVWCLRGNLLETEYRFTQGFLRKKAEMVFAESQAALVYAEEIHSSVALNDALTLHVYWPKILRMKIYDPFRQEVLTVQDNVGAWFDLLPEQIQHRQTWCAFNP